MKFLECDNRNIKVVMPIIDLDKFYKKIGNLWIKVSDFKITDNFYILYKQNLY